MWHCLTKGPAVEAGPFVTFLLLHLDIKNHTLEVVSAGHFPLYVRRAATGTIEAQPGAVTLTVAVTVTEPFRLSFK